jgi:predicted nucleotidyltransferase
MIYNISSDKLNNLLLKDLLKELTVFFDSINVKFYVIGATARDIILCNLYNLTPNRKTVDLDIAIAIIDWNQFAEIEQQLSVKSGFSKSNRQKQRFVYQDIYIVDIVPFGDVANADGNIYWPPDEDIAMSVWGFSDVAKATLVIRIDNEFTIRIASLPGIFLLKLTAWKDRYLSSSKDAYDMALILSNYLEINMGRAINDHYELFDTDKFDLVVAGARLMARDVRKLLCGNEIVLNYIRDIVSKEINLAEESWLINQLLESNSILNYEQVLSCLEYIKNEWEN